MNNSISIRLHSNHILVLETPNDCPLCSKAVHIDTTVAYYQIYESKTVQVVYQCPNRECRHYFIGYYQPSDSLQSVTHETRTAHLIEFKPTGAHHQHFSPELSALSPAFTSLYPEALTAKHHGLYQVAGLGLRKAFATLVRDYAIRTAPCEEKSLRKLPVLSVVQDYIRDERVIGMAEEILSGQENKQWGASDMEDLVTLINAARHSIMLAVMEQSYDNRSRETSLSASF